MVTVRRGVVALVLLIGLLIGGCNVFEVSNFSPDTVDDLLSDARTALAAGNADRAVRLLERAFEKDSTDVRVRVELGNALYSERGLDAFALRAAAEHLVDSTGSAGGSGVPGGGPENQVCTDNATPPSDRYVQIPLDAESLRRLSDHASVVNRVRRLVVEGVLDKRTAVFDSSSVRIRRTGFLVGAFTVVTGGVIAVPEAFGGTGGTLYLDRAARPHHALVACAPDEEALARNHDALCALSDATRRGIEWIQARNRLSGRGEEGDVLVDRLQSVVEAARARTGCS